VSGRAVDDRVELEYCIDAVVLGRDDHAPLVGRWVEVEPGDEGDVGDGRAAGPEGDAAGRGEAAGAAADAAGADTRGTCADGDRGDDAATTAVQVAAVGDILTDGDPPSPPPPPPPPPTAHGTVVEDIGIVKRKGTAPLAVFGGDGQGPGTAAACGAVAVVVVDSCGNPDECKAPPPP
jgi:hypothetical protein